MKAAAARLLVWGMNAWLFSACSLMDEGSTNETSVVAQGELEGFVACLKERPQICTRQYEPVCASDLDGYLSTQGNACSDVRTKGECPQ